MNQNNDNIIVFAERKLNYFSSCLICLLNIFLFLTVVQNKKYKADDILIKISSITALISIMKTVCFAILNYRCLENYEENTEIEEIF
jgi:hypothetical protein